MLSKTFRFALAGLLIITTAFAASSQNIKTLTHSMIANCCDGLHDTVNASWASPPPHTLQTTGLMIKNVGWLSAFSDTICVDRQQFVRMLTKAEQARALEQQRDLLFNQVDTLKARISIKEMQIVNLNGQISDYKSIVSSKDAIINTQSEQRKIWEANVASLNKEVKRQRRAKKWTAFAGLLTTGIATYFIIKK